MQLLATFLLPKLEDDEAAKLEILSLFQNIYIFFHANFNLCFDLFPLQKAEVFLNVNKNENI